MALDFAVTSGLRDDVIQATANDPAAPLTQYEDRKRNHLSTAQLCADEGMGFTPDIVTLAKSLSGMGLPFALTLFRPELDQWSPGEHNGTFRGNNHAFVTATAALRHFWSNDAFQQDVARRGALLERRLDAMAAEHGLSTRGRGMMRGIDVGSGEVAGTITAACFAQGLIIETSGAHDEIVKVLAPLVIEDAVLSAGLDILEESIRSALGVTYGVAAE